MRSDTDGNFVERLNWDAVRRRFAST